MCLRACACETNCLHSCSTVLLWFFVHLVSHAHFVQHSVDVVLLVGYMRILSNAFVDRYQGRLLNVHPSLLPAFAGGMDLNVHQAVLDAKVSQTGCTVHLVTREVDAGPILVQSRCDVLAHDDAESLKSRVQALEGPALIHALRLFRSCRGSLFPPVGSEHALTYAQSGVSIDAGR
jgi:folate-dependent phosphoribosylglycinamide formyltransferase PurN